MTADEKAALATLRDAKTAQERYSAIIAIGKKFMTNLAPEVAGYLHDPDPELRSAAIRTLGFYWRLPAYREIAEQMIREEPDAATRGIAVLAWAAYDEAAGSRRRCAACTNSWWTTPKRPWFEAWRTANSTVYLPKPSVARSRLPRSIGRSKTGRLESARRSYTGFHDEAYLGGYDVRHSLFDVGAHVGSTSVGAGAGVEIDDATAFADVPGYVIRWFLSP